MPILCIPLLRSTSIDLMHLLCIDQSYFDLGEYIAVQDRVMIHSPMFSVVRMFMESGDPTSWRSLRIWGNATEHVVRLHYVVYWYVNLRV